MQCNKGFPKNRYEALDEVHDFLKFNGTDLDKVFEVLLSSSDGYLIYSFGNVEIQFTRGFGVWSESQSTIQLSIEFHNGRTKKDAVYEYRIKELELLRKSSFVLKTLEENELE